MQAIRVFLPQAAVGSAVEFLAPPLKMFLRRAFWARSSFPARDRKCVSANGSFPASRPLCAEAFVLTMKTKPIL